MTINTVLNSINEVKQDAIKNNDNVEIELSNILNNAITEIFNNLCVSSKDLNK
jgi:hypothetical protein